MNNNLKRRQLEKELEAANDVIPVNNMGKWAKQVRIDSIISRIKKFITKRKVRPSDDNPPAWDDNAFHTESDFQ